MRDTQWSIPKHLQVQAGGEWKEKRKAPTSPVVIGGIVGFDHQPRDPLDLHGTDLNQI